MGKKNDTIVLGTKHLVSGMVIIGVIIGIILLIKAPTTTGETAGELSGTIVEMNPDRAMAGSPCHVMGGQVMGDCMTREVQLEAWRYDWSEPTIVVKTGELVRIIAKSRDVTHGIAIPEIGFNLQIDPGKTSIGEFIAPNPGEYAYGCSVMCGSGHRNHRGKLIVLK